MKFMKLGSKPDCFQTEGKNVRYMTNELPSDIIVNVVDIKFHLHKFPLLSKSSCLQKLVSSVIDESTVEISLDEVPGGPTAFEICAKFCYGMTVILNAYNVVAVRCAAEYLGMHEYVEKGNLIYKIDVFLNSSIFRAWKDSIIVLQTTRSMLPFLEDLNILSNCIDSIASKASVDSSRVDWSYTYNHKKLPEEPGQDRNMNGVRSRLSVPKDWWIEDLCDIEPDLYRPVIMTISSKGRVSKTVIGRALKAYALRRLPGYSNGLVSSKVDSTRIRSIVDMIVELLPSEKGEVCCSLLLLLLKASFHMDVGEMAKNELVKRIGCQLEEASVNDLVLLTNDGGDFSACDVDLVQQLVGEFQRQADGTEIELHAESEALGKKCSGVLSDASKIMVAKLIDGYLAEIAKYPNLSLSMFISLAEMVVEFPRSSHDSLYTAIDMYLKEHPSINKSERKKICRLMDCKRLSAEASAHAVQNDRLPLRVIVQVLFFEQARAAAAASSGGSTPDLPKCIKDMRGDSNRSSRSATTNTEEWDAVATVEELKALKGELVSMAMTGGGERRVITDKAAAVNKMKGMLLSKRIFKMWSAGKGGAAQGDHSGSDSSGSVGSANPEESKSTPARSRRHSVS